MAKTSVASTRRESTSPKQITKSTPPTQSASASPSTNLGESLKAESTASTEQLAKPLAPPPRPAQQPSQQTGNTPDYFSTQVGGGSLSLEPNPFEQSFGAPPETPGGTKLPSVAALTSPSSLLPGGGATPFNWGGGSLRTGPLSPAMLSGPASDYFGDTHLRGGFPTPNESSLRTGLTPGGSGSMFPAPSPNSQALFAQLQTGNATPNTLDFHRTAINAAAAKREQRNSQASQQQQQQKLPATAASSQPSHESSLPSVTSAPSATKPEAKTLIGPFDPHDNDAANGLYLLAQGRNSAQPQAPYTIPPPPQNQQQQQQQPSAPLQATATHTMAPVPVPGQNNSNPQAASQMAQDGRANMPGSAFNSAMRSQSNSSQPNTDGGSGLARGSSDAGSAASDEGERPAVTTKGRGKRTAAEIGSNSNGRRKAQDSPGKAGPTSKRAKTNGNASSAGAGQDLDMDTDSNSEDEDDGKPGKDGLPKQKMTEEEKRKNFLERNRVAALKCRQRKKQWLQNLQTKVEMYSTENESLSAQISQLREEVVNLKTLLLAHKDCPVTQQQSIHGTFIHQTIEPFGNQQIHSYGMGAGMQSQPVMAGQRRYS